MAAARAVRRGFESDALRNDDRHSLLDLLPVRSWFRLERSDRDPDRAGPLQSAGGLSTRSPVVGK